MSPRPEVRVLANERWRVGVVPETAACVAFGQVRLGDRWVDVLRPTPPSGLRVPPRCASSVLAPVSHRVRDGALRFGGRTWQLRRNSGDGNAMHGAALEFPWDVVAADDTAMTLRFDAGAVVGANFPWRFVVEVTYALDGPRLTTRTVLTSTDDEVFPAGFGHHPFFLRALDGAEESEVRLEVPCEAAWPLEAGLATGPAGPVPPHADHRRLRELDGVFVDECLTARVPGAPARMEWPRSGLAVQLHADDVFRHLVLYAPRRRPFFAVEPVTNANDAFNLLADGVPGHGLVELAPGEALVGAYHLDAGLL